MSAPTNHWKLGAFVVGSVLVGLGAVAALAARTLQIETVGYTSYFDEGVTGLEPGSPVSFRGVKIGNVAAIDVAPDRRHVEVRYSLGVKVLGRLGLVSGGLGKETKLVVPSDLRVQIASSGLTGTKFIQLDFFSVASSPPPVLPFEVPENYIPATSSTMKNLEDAVIRAVDALPEIAAGVAKVLDKVNALLDDASARQIPAHTAATLSSINRLVTSLQGKLDEVPVKELSQETAVLLKGAATTLNRVNRLVERLDGVNGLVASMQRTSDSLGDVAGAGLGDSLGDMARELKDAAGAMREFLSALDRDPDMLLKGKAKHR